MEPVQQTTQMDPAQQTTETTLILSAPRPITTGRHQTEVIYNRSNTGHQSLQSTKSDIQQIYPSKAPYSICSSVSTKIDTATDTSAQLQPTESDTATEHSAKLQPTESETAKDPLAHLLPTASNTASDYSAQLQPTERDTATDSSSQLEPKESETATDPSAQLQPSESDTAKDPSAQPEITSGTDIIRLSSTVTEEESNFLRFCHLVQKIAPQAVRCQFDQQFPPDQLNAIIQRNMTKLMELKTNRVLTKTQWKLILPYRAKVTSTNFDVTLMVLFFRHLSYIAPQYCDYDTLPPPSDESLGADLARIKYYRNFIAHCLEKDRKMDNFEFPICWETVSKAVSRIGGHRYELECSNLLVGTLDQSYIEVYRNFQVEKTELKEKLEALELQLKDPLPPNVRENIQIMIDQWKITDERFVKTDASIYVLQIIKTNNFIIVTGSPGCGKSFTVQHVLLLLINEGYDVIPVTTSSDMVKYFSKKSRQVFYIDNFCGKCNISSNDIEDYQRNKEQIDTMFKYASTKCIVTCRLQIFKDLKFKNLHLDNFKVCDFSGSLQISLSEKILIGRQYLPENIVKTLSDETINKFECFPLLCALYRSHAHEGSLFFEQPNTYFETEINELQKSSDKIKYSCLALCVMYNDHVPFEIFTTRSNYKAKQIFDVIFEECAVNLATPKKSVLSQFESMVGSFFAKTETGYRSIHDYMFDIYCNHFFSNMLQCIVEYADSGLISDRALLQSIKQKDTPGKALIPIDLETVFFNRIKQDIIDCKIRHVFAAFQMKYKPYRVKVIKVLESIKHDINQQDIHSVTPVYVVCGEGYYDILDILVCKGGDVNKCSTDGASPLWIASFNGHKVCVDFLLNSGAEINKCDDEGYSPLNVASEQGHTTILEMLYNNGGDINLCDNEGASPLFNASLNGHKDCVHFLLSNGAEANKCDNEGYSPLHVASQEGHTSILKMLYNRGGDVKLCNKDGETPLRVAYLNGHKDCVDFLLEVNKCYCMGCSPLYVASHKGYNNILEMLYNKGDVNLRHRNKTSTPNVASFNGHKDSVGFLLDNGTEVNTCDSMGCSPLYLASQKGYTTILQMLYNRGGDVNLCNKDGASPLWIASYKGHKDCVEFLLNNGAEVNKCNKFGVSPLNVAAQEGHTSILEMLYNKVAMSL